eukprot:scaffold2639_cov385-Prasinococcus_capsulatus_cf.AAC.10
MKAKRVVAHAKPVAVGRRAARCRQSGSRSPFASEGLVRRGALVLRLHYRPGYSDSNRGWVPEAVVELLEAEAPRKSQLAGRSQGERTWSLGQGSVGGAVDAADRTVDGADTAVAARMQGQGALVELPGGSVGRKQTAAGVAGASLAGQEGRTPGSESCRHHQAVGAPCPEAAFRLQAAQSDLHPVADRWVCPPATTTACLVACLVNGLSTAQGRGGCERMVVDASCTCTTLDP